jgi:hypothetical protein
VTLQSSSGIPLGLVGPKVVLLLNNSLEDFTSLPKSVLSILSLLGF